MNKKFSTLLLGALLAGAFTTANAERVTTQKEFVALIKNGVLTLNDDELVFAAGDYKVPFYAHHSNGTQGGEYVIVNTANLKITGEEGAVITGRLAITAENVTVSGLDFINNGLEEVTNPASDASIGVNKSSISVFANKVTITNNDFIRGDIDATNMSLQGIELMPKEADVEYSISGNTFTGFTDVVPGADGVIYPAYAVSLDESYEMGGSQGYMKLYLGGVIEGYKSASDVKFDAATMVANNTFEGCAFDYATINEPDNANTPNSKLYDYAQVTPIKDNSGKILNAANIAALVNNAVDDAVVVFNGKAEDFNKAVENKVITEGANVAVVCNDGNVLYGTAENPDNGQSAVVADVKPVEDIFAGYELLESINSDYNLLVLRSDNNGEYYVVTIENDKAKAVQVTGKNATKSISDFATESAALWQVTESADLDGNVYYSFKNQDGDQLKSVKATSPNEDPTGLDGRFFSANNAKYNNGVVLSVDGFELNEGNKNYFGLYEAGKNVLTVGNLNYFEQDGFSVTIKYQDADGKFTKEDIAGNEFVGHLTPMKWDSSKEEFVEAPAAEKEFYLKNADGEYIVVNAKDNGDVADEDVLYFTTLSEEALEHHLVADDEQEYFGLFQAKVSASNQTDYKKLTALDELQVKIGDDWASIGRWDKDSEPTLAASIETSLKPIQIALGSDKIVKAKDLLKKGKFYTVEIVASTEDNDPMVGKKLVASAQSDENDYRWVKSYGNVLEGQFALTIEDNEYVFTNREQNYWAPLGIAVNALYTTDEENEYRWAGTDWTLKIDTVAGHKASDGYQTLEDVKNNKFYIGYASGVFGGNAWLVENHEGDENHVIGLDINQEDALIFSAKEYSAARQLKVEDKETHKYYYAPSDSIYVISELGYFDGDDYKTTLDTLKLVSYSFVNQYTEPLIYSENGEDRYESDVYKEVYDSEAGKWVEVRYKNVEDAHSNAQHFALRIDGTKLNLRPVFYSDYGTKVYEDVDALNENWVGAWTESDYKALGKDADKFLYQGLNGNDKVYSGDAGEEGMLSNTYYLNREENDLFVVEPTEKPMYRTVINPLDTISIFRDDNSQSVLFEHNTFLGMENLSQYPEIAKAMIADTAYVRNNTYRPQYMLVVGADITPAGKWCPIHGDDPTCPDAHKVETSGWVEGRYLVNLVDTAIAWDAANKHKDNNPYINSEKYYRLGFVQAKHINDSLVIASTNDTLYVGSEDYNQAKFAFRYVDQEVGSFVIETANYNRLPGVEEAEINEDAPLGYLKWMNGVVVVVDDINNADVYNMNENETDTPTANEDIAVEEGVEVIAGNGAVTIQGAAGKTVVITNILGKAVANTTLTSDNQTINVPAGIVVVTVDGEAVKAIVK